MSHTTLLRAKRAMREYGIDGIPTIVVLDKQGMVREYWTGHSPSLVEELLPIIEPLLE
ncbi:MAG TPA: hypothetical protein VFX78_07630 [Candidatus Eisenbacteria bacterium]|nr:hypothetical protein [Candidatus Eisenbacteria bacterium]